MSYYQRSQGRYAAPQTSQPIHGAPGANETVSNHLHRSPSFDHGDDVQRHDGSMEYEQAYGTRTYRSGSNADRQREELFMSSSDAALPNRTPSHVSGGYQHQGVPLPANGQRSYNPQQYPPVQPQYSPQSSMTNHFSPIAPQPYVPAAYQPSQPANAPYSSNYGGQTYGSAQQGHPSSRHPYLSSQPPPPPERLIEQPYGNRISTQTGADALGQNTSLQYSHSQQYGAPTLPPRPGYTPPIPPPPPFSPIRDSYTSMSSSAASRPYSHRTSPSQNRYIVPDRFSPTQSPLPAVPPRHSSNGGSGLPSPSSYRTHLASSNSLLDNSLPPTPGTPGPTPPQHSPQRTNTTGRHPQARPLPGPPPDGEDDTDYFGGRDDRRDASARYNGDPGYEDLMRQVEAAVMGRETRANDHRSPTMRTPINESNSPQPLFAPESTPSPDLQNSHSYTNGHLTAPQQGSFYSEGSDAEAEAGLAALQMADEQDAADEARRQSGALSFTESYHTRESSRLGVQSTDERGSDSDVPIDINSYGGGFSGHVHYGDQPFSHQSSHESYAEQDYEHRPGVSQGMYDYSIPEADDLHPFPPTLSARVDTGGTGGLSEPGAHPRRLSFEDGDEATLAESEGAQNSATASPSHEEMPEMYFHPGSGATRPLPPAPVGSANKNRIPHLMPAGSYQQPGVQNNEHFPRPSYPPAPDAYNQLLSPSGTPVPRSSSLISHSSTPQAVPPIRSKTDADRARILKQQGLSGIRTASTYGSEFGGPDSSIPQSAELLGLPEIPAGKRKKFNPAKLSTNDFKRCLEPWALSSVVAWIKDISEGETDLKEHAIVDGIVALFTHKVPTMNTADAETLGARVVKAMFAAGALLKEEEWVKFGVQPMSGVLFQLTGTGCYSPRVHSHTLPGRCYAHHCMRTLKKINLQTQILEPQRKVEDWVTFYKLSKQNIENVNKTEIERQNNLHEIVTTEDLFMDQLNVLRMLYRDELAKWQPPILTPKRKDGFLSDVFGKVDAIKQVNEDHLLAQLKYRQQEQGPWIIGFSDIFREWIRKAKNAYIEYAANFPNATFLIRQEAERNILFRQFLDQTRDNERSKRLGWDTYLKAPITRLQRYGLLLSTVYKHMTQESEEKTNLAAAIEEIKAVTLECDGKVADMAKSVSLSELASKLQLRPGMEKVHLNLKHLGREVILQGDLQRTGSNKFTWLDTHAILFDHYLVLAKTVTQRDAAGGLKYEKYDVSKLPIPMDLLVLETTDEDPVVKSKLGAVTTKVQPSRPSVSMAGPNGSTGPGTLAHTNTGTSMASVTTVGSAKTMVTSTALDSPTDSEGVLYPFRIKHLGKDDVYTLYASTAQNRQEWCEKIIEAKTRHAASLFQQNAEPFRLRVIADTAFANDAMSAGPRSIVIRGTPLERAIREVENTFATSGSRPSPICRATVNCATTFNQPMGNPMLAVGTDYGVYITPYNNPRGWSRVSQQFCFWSSCLNPIVCD